MFDSRSIPGFGCSHDELGKFYARSRLPKRGETISIPFQKSVSIFHGKLIINDGKFGINIIFF